MTGQDELNQMLGRGTRGRKWSFVLLCAWGPQRIGTTDTGRQTWAFCDSAQPMQGSISDTAVCVDK